VKMIGNHELKLKQGLLLGLGKQFPPFPSEKELQLEWWAMFRDFIKTGIDLAIAEDELEAHLGDVYQCEMCGHKQRTKAR